MIARTDVGIQFLIPSTGKNMTYKEYIMLLTDNLDCLSDVCIAGKKLKRDFPQ